MTTKILINRKEKPTMKEKTKKELGEIQQIYNKMGVCVHIDKYGEIIHTDYR